MSEEQENNCVTKNYKTMINIFNINIIFKYSLSAIRRSLDHLHIWRILLYILKYWSFKIIIWKKLISCDIILVLPFECIQCSSSVSHLETLLNRDPWELFSPLGDRRKVNVCAVRHVKHAKFLAVFQHTANNTYPVVLKSVYHCGRPLLV